MNKEVRFLQTLMLAAALTLFACAKQDLVSEKIAEVAGKHGACANYDEKIRAVLIDALNEDQVLPTAREIETALSKNLVPGQEPDDKQKQFIAHVQRLYVTLTEETKQNLKLTNSRQLLEAMTALEIGDRTTAEKSALVDKLQTEFQAVKAQAAESGMECNDGAPPSTLPPQEKPEDEDERELQSLNPVVSGAVRVMATAYQSCTPVHLAALTEDTPDVKGIKIIGKHANGIGAKRGISDLAALNRTHPYIKYGIEHDASCFDVTKKPLIYDYGGKPFATSGDDAKIDFFKNAGSGTDVLGIDCSAFVTSSLAASGLRLSPGKKIKAYHTAGVSARMLMSPSSNGMQCLAEWSPKSSDTLKSGDIVATTGHVVIVEVTGDDPFGLSRANSAADCTTSKINDSGFDFDIVQSSPVKNGIGIDRIRASAFLKTHSSMQSTFASYAVMACHAKFGKSTGSPPTAGRITRHKRTTECLDRRVALEKEACVKACFR